MMFDAVLPGLWTAVVGGALAWLLRRWFEPLPAAVWVVFSVVILVLLGPVLFAGDILLPLDNLRGFVPFQHLEPVEPHGNFLQGDLIQLIAPSQQLVRAELLAGRWPLWNPHAGLGMPLLADPQAQAFQPLTLLALPVPWPQAAAVLAALRLLLTLTFTFLFLRRLGVSPGAATAGALAFGLSGYLVLWLGWPLANSAVFLPVVLYALARLLPAGAQLDAATPDASKLTPQRRDAILLICGLSGLLLAGHPETILYVLAFATSFFLVRACDATLAAAQRTRRLHVTALAALVAVCITAPVWLPAAHLLPLSARQAHLDEPQTSEPQTSKTVAGSESWGTHLAHSWLQVAAPNAFGNSRYLHYWGRDNSNEDAAGFVGTTTLLAALLALSLLVSRSYPPSGGGATHGGRPGRGVPGLGIPGLGAMPWLFAGWLLLSLALVAQPATLTRLLQDLPLVGGASAHGNRRLWLLVAFCLAVLAALALDAAAENARQRRSVQVSVLVLGCALAALIFWAYTAFPHPDDPALLAPLRDGWRHWQLRFLAAAVTVLLLASGRWFSGRWLSGKGLSGSWVGWACALLIAAELLLAHGDANPAMPRRLALPWSASITGVSATPATLDYLQRHLQPGERMAALGKALPPNLASLYGLGDARIYNPLEPAAYQQLLAPLLLQPRDNVPEFEVPEFEVPEFEVPEPERAVHPLYARLRVRYLLTRPDTSLPAPWELVLDAVDGRVYRLPWRATCRLVPEADDGWRLEWDPGTDACEVPLFQDGGWRAQWRPRAASDGRGPWRNLDLDVATMAPGKTADVGVLPLLRPPTEAAVEARLIHRAPGLWWGGLLAALGWALAFTFFASDLTIRVPAGAPTPVRTRPPPRQ